MSTPYSMKIGSNAAWQESHLDLSTYHGRWPETMIHGVFFRSTEARSFLSQSSCAPLGAKGPAFSAALPPGRSGASGNYAQTVELDVGKGLTMFVLVTWTYICFRIELDIVHHAIVPGKPEVLKTSGLLRRHAEVVSEAREVCLALHADTLCVGTCSSVITVRLVVACLEFGVN